MFGVCLGGKSRHIPSAATIDEGADVFDTPHGGASAELDALGVFTLLDAIPPGRAADGDEGQDLRQT